MAGPPGTALPRSFARLHLALAPALIALAGGPFVHASEADAPPVDNAALARAERDLLSFLQRRMLGPRGAPHTRVPLRPGALAGEGPNARAVLSESIGLLMTYAVLADSRGLFDSQRRLVRRVLQGPHGLLAWRASRSLGRVDPSSASIDDLTVIRALLRGSARWSDPALEGEAAVIAHGVFDHQVADDLLMDAASWDEHGVYTSGDVQLAYLDLRTMADLAERDGVWEPVYGRSLELLRGAETTPGLFAEIWRPDGAGLVASAEVNGILAGYCALHLAEVGEGGETTLALFQELFDERGALPGRFASGTGEPLTGFEGVAVYAIAARLALALGDLDAAEQLIGGMLQYQRTDPRSATGAFSLGDTAHTFDNLHALIALRSLRLARDGEWAILGP